MVHYEVQRGEHQQPFPPAMKFGVVIFPGSNCDHDALYALSRNLGQTTSEIWHESEDLGDVDAVFLPGGFSYGDYLRCGAIARFSPVIRSVRRFAHAGGLVLGVCNGFQILVEAGLLPGVLMRNQGLRFVCRTVELVPGTTDSAFTSESRPGKPLRIPVAHGEGRYFADQATLDRLEAEDRVAFRYHGHNPNGPLRGPQRPGHDAPPRARVRCRRGLDRWHRRLPVYDCRYRGRERRLCRLRSTHRSQPITA